MNRKELLAALTLAFVLFGTVLGALAFAKEETVTLTITGMTGGRCVSAVQSALQAVKGVKEAKVSLEKREAVVKYDSDQAKVEVLIKAVKNVKGMSVYDAKVKENN